MIHSFFRSSIHSFIRSFIHSFNRSFIHSFVNSFFHSFLISQWSLWIFLTPLSPFQLKTVFNFLFSFPSFFLFFDFSVLFYIIFATQSVIYDIKCSSFFFKTILLLFINFYIPATNFLFIQLVKRLWTKGYWRYIN